MIDREPLKFDQIEFKQVMKQGPLNKQSRVMQQRSGWLR